MILSFGDGETNIASFEDPEFANANSIWCVPFLNSLFCQLYLTNENVGDEPMSECLLCLMNCRLNQFGHRPRPPG